MPQDIRYRIQGITPLRGDVTLSGAKNAALPCMCAALLTEEAVTLRNVPEIADIFTLLKIFTFLGVEYTFSDHVLTISAKNLQSKKIPHDLVKKFRASILLLGPLLARCGEAVLAYPGGCVLGKRPVDAHINALVQLGVENLSDSETLHIKGNITGGEIVLSEFSVTATENVLLAASGINNTTIVHIAATEPHVQDLCRLLSTMGAKIDGIGTHDLAVHGGIMHGAEHTVTTDYLEAGFFALAGVLTGGDLRIHGVERDQLLSFFTAMDAIGAPCSFEEEHVLRVHGGAQLKSCRVKTNIFPGFPTDLQAAMGVAMTQANGVSRIFERLYEGRFGYLFELEKMGANIEMLTAHEALIIGPTPLSGRLVISNDIRAGAGMVLAALCARGETLITDVQYVERGYDQLPKKLRSLGASIDRDVSSTDVSQTVEESTRYTVRSTHAKHPVHGRSNTSLSDEERFTSTVS